MPADYIVGPSTAPVAELLVASETAWAEAQAISWGPAPWITRFRALATQAALALRFDVYDERPWHTMTRRDEHIWEEEVVEIFLDPDRTGTNYYELEINPANVVCDLVVPRPWPELHSDPAWDFAGLDTRVRPYRGEGAGPDGWTATAWLPWDGFRPLPSAAPLPPRDGDRWRFNVYRIKRPHGPARPHDDVINAAWSPTGSPSFHVPSAFGNFVFKRG
jgi:cellulose/xylan binding protein with CBM9 domain